MTWHIPRRRRSVEDSDSHEGMNGYVVMNSEELSKGNETGFLKRGTNM